MSGRAPVGAVQGRVKQQYVEKLKEVQLSKPQQEALMCLVRDSRLSEQQRFFRVRDVIFEALARDHLGDDVYSRIKADATEKARTVVSLAVKN